MVINALMKRFLIKNVLQEAHASVIRGSQWPDEDELEFEAHFSKPTRQCCHTFTVMGNVNYYVCGLKSSIREGMLEELRRMPPKVRSNLMYVIRTAAAKGRS